VKTRAIEHKTLDWIRRQGLIEDGDTVLAALSGGADSVCLVRVLMALRAQLDIRIVAAHYNHRLRGEASERDAGFVRQFCEKFDIPLVVGSGDVAEAARTSERGIEETAREMRYAFLEDAARESGASKIATGHHADDNAETVLLHLIRGAGLRGLAGIPPCRGRIIRPILALERREIEDYLAALGQDFVEDATNRDTALRRNAMRHQVMPILREMNPGLAGTVSRQSGVLRQDGRCLDAVAKEVFAKIGQRDVEDAATYSIDITELGALDPSIASRVVVLAVQAAGGEADAVHVRQVLKIAGGCAPSAETAVRGGVMVRRVYDKLVFGARARETVSFQAAVLPENGTILIPEAGLRITVGAENLRTLATISDFCFKSIAICGRITARLRRTGDELRLAGRSGTKTVKKLMIEAKVPAEERGGRLIFADEAGVIAVSGIGIAERVAPQAGDETVTIVVEELI